MNSESAGDQHLACLDDFVPLHPTHERDSRDVIAPRPAGRREDLVETVGVCSRVGKGNDSSPPAILGRVSDSPFDLGRIKWLRQLRKQSIKLWVYVRVFGRYRYFSSKK